MNPAIDYSPALKKLARAQADFLLTSHGDVGDRIANFIESHLKQLPSLFVVSAYQEHKLMEEHTHHEEPQRPGMYLKLLHGRKHSNEEMDDWGLDGPWIGPLRWFHCTYLSSVGIGFEDGGELGAMSPGEEVPSPMFFFEGLLYFSGMYYGDWELQTCGFA